MMLSAFSRSIISETVAGTWAAETLMTKRSTRRGSEAMLGKQRQPSRVSVPGLMRKTFRRSKPSRSRLLTMIWPGLSFSETPMTAIDLGSSRFCIFWTGRGFPSGSRRSPSLTSASTAISFPFRITSGLISRSVTPARPNSSATDSSFFTASRRSANERRGAWPLRFCVSRPATAVFESSLSIVSSSNNVLEKMAMSLPVLNVLVRNSV